MQRKKKQNWKISKYRAGAYEKKCTQFSNVKQSISDDNSFLFQKRKSLAALMAIKVTKLILSLAMKKSSKTRKYEINKLKNFIYIYIYIVVI